MTGKAVSSRELLPGEIREKEVEEAKREADYVKLNTQGVFALSFFGLSTGTSIALATVPFMNYLLDKKQRLRSISFGGALMAAGTLNALFTGWLNEENFSEYVNINEGESFVAQALFERQDRPLLEGNLLQYVLEEKNLIQVEGEYRLVQKFPLEFQYSLSENGETLFDNILDNQTALNLTCPWDVEEEGGEYSIRNIDRIELSEFNGGLLSKVGTFVDLNALEIECESRSPVNVSSYFPQ